MRFAVPVPGAYRVLEHDPPQDERAAEEHPHAAQQRPRAAGARDRRQELEEEEGGEQQVEEARFRRDDVEDLRRRRDERCDHHGPPDTFSSGVRPAFTRRRRRAAPAAHQGADEQHAQRRPTPARARAARRCRPRAARPRSATVRNNSGRTMASRSGGHLRCRKTLSGLKSDGSRVTPRVSSALSSSAVCISSPGSSTTSAMIRRGGDRAIHRLEPFSEQRVVVVDATPPFPVVAVGDVELHPRVAVGGVGAVERRAGLRRTHPGGRSRSRPGTPVRRRYRRRFRTRGRR